MCVTMMRGVLYLVCDIIAINLDRQLEKHPSLDLWQEVEKRWGRLAQFLEHIPSFPLRVGSLAELWDKISSKAKSGEAYPGIDQLGKMAFRSQVRHLFS